MKTNNPAIAKNDSKMNSFVILAGIVIAFICSFVVFQNVSAADRERAEATESESIVSSYRLPVGSPRINEITGVVNMILPR